MAPGSRQSDVIPPDLRGSDNRRTLWHSSSRDVIPPDLRGSDNFVMYITRFRRDVIPPALRGSDNSCGRTKCEMTDVIPPERGSDNCRRKRLPYIFVLPPPLGADSALAHPVQNSSDPAEIQIGGLKSALLVALCGAGRVVPLPGYSGNSRPAPTPDSARRAGRMRAMANPNRRIVRKSPLRRAGRVRGYPAHSTLFSPVSPQKSPSLDELAGFPAPAYGGGFQIPRGRVHPNRHWASR